MPITPLSRLGAVLSAVILTSLLATAAQAATPPGFDPDRHMTVDEVRPGMTGYGLTVYHGTKIEPFAVEVISVQRGFKPGKSVVWIRCPDERMQLTGPVQGMSGSPIFLWEDGEKHKLGEGGRMIGAFAFGHRLGKDCYAGVQPITQMLETAARIKPGQADENEALQASAPSIREKTLAAMYQIAEQARLDEHATWRLNMLSKVSGLDPDALAGRPAAKPDTATDNRLMLPVTVGSSEQASLLEPLYAIHGLAAQAAPTGPASLAPNWIDPDQIKIQPGGVFAVPLTFGPLEMAAIGTTTEVLPDGTALAFGHQFFAQGPIAVPMAPGYVHFVQPNLSASFKLGGALDVTGAVVRDETSAIVGKPEADYPTVPATIRVRWPHNPAMNQDHEYTVVHHQRLLPSLVGTIAAASLTADTELPQQNTMDVSANISFEDGRSLQLRELAPNATSANVIMSMVPPIAALIENDFSSLKVKSVDATVTVRNQVEAGSVMSATLEESTIAPGETLVVHVRVKPFRQAEEIHRLELKVPNDVRSGEYMLTVGGSRIYAQQLAAMRPHLLHAENENDLFESVQQLLGVQDDALYAVLALTPHNNLAIGRSELPSLPSSRLAMLRVESSTRTSPFIESVEAVKELPYVVVNALTLPVTIKEDMGNGSARR